MLLLIYGIALAIFWYLTTGVKPDRYPNAEVDAIQSWQQMRLSCCHQFAGLFLVWIILAFFNGAVGHYVSTVAASSTWHDIFRVSVVVTIVYVISVLVFTVYKLWQSYQFGRRYHII